MATYKKKGFKSKSNKFDSNKKASTTAEVLKHLIKVLLGLSN